MKKEKKYLSREDLVLSEQDFLAKYKISRATYYRAKKSGYYIPKYHEHIVDIDHMFVEKNWDLIIECSTIAALIIVKREKGAAFGKLFKMGDLKNEALLKIVEKSGQVTKISAKITNLKGYLIALGMYAIRDFLKSKLYRHSNRSSDLNDRLSQPEEEKNIFNNVNIEKFIEDIKSTIISRYGEYGWQEVWKWANSDIKRVSKKIQTILDSVTN